MHAITSTLVLCALCAAVSGAAWTSVTFPNPNTNSQACGRVQQSWICDPDDLLGAESKDVVEGILKLIHTGEEPYVKAQCGSAGNVGFQVRRIISVQ